MFYPSRARRAAGPIHTDLTRNSAWIRGRASENAAVAMSARLTSAARPVWATRPGRGEVALAVLAFAVLCFVVLRVAPVLVEPDDWAYRASIVGVTDGHLAALSAAQVHALSAQLTRSMGGNAAVLGPGPRLIGIVQWVQLPDRRWISEKDPGYPYLAAPFQAIGLIRLAPPFYGALACLVLFAGAGRWLGQFGGAAAVGLYCSSGAALLFAWRDYMPTFTDASLIAAGAGALLWAVLAEDASARRRRWTGLAGFSRWNWQRSPGTPTSSCSAARCWPWPRCGGGARMPCRPAR